MHANLSFLVAFPNDTPPPFPASPSPAGVEQANQSRLQLLAAFPGRLPPGRNGQMHHQSGFPDWRPPCPQRWALSTPAWSI
ncbi:uncharacterized protein TrAtP1_000310 [Trichoderma atroviride]|uniref:Uncharacterized protein n=1 Tax=Hypocrea atroviridis (strain ATCC 20476 / IMI 206040) TaxID=452589 RepID=G9NJM4_HYPAI|nr:uncharacterized protein TRIATDRAFT_255118 [Trichoderma atroviride IMI 206040]EHK49097.1 hypothetical protein TRIATDRAFT_255118 [Trichoderma atroviride IMI 206040]UKZ58988.1 hypothetical protein TrAtP1_000310 [Trichoderma atroviride]